MGTSGPETIPVAGAANLGTASLDKAGALVGFFPNNNTRNYRITFVDDTEYRLEWQEPGGTWTQDDNVGRIDLDSVFYGDPTTGQPTSGAFILSQYWSGGAPAAGDTFTFSADPTAKTIEMPVLFGPEYDGGTFDGLGAYTTDHANSLVSGTKVVTGDTYGPRVDFDGSGAKDILKEYVTSMFVRAGYTAADIHWADARLYHNLCGSLHCGTNVQREVPTYNWWEAP